MLTASLIGRTAVARLRPLRGVMTEAEGWILSYAIGSALLSSAMFALCAAGWVTDASVVLLGAAATACWLRWGRWTWPPKQGQRRSPDSPLLLAVILPASIYGVLYVVHTLAPETRSDAMGYHLGLVQRYYRASGFVPLTTNVYAQISQGTEMLYLFAYAIGRGVGGQDRPFFRSWSQPSARFSASLGEFDAILPESSRRSSTSPARL